MIILKMYQEFFSLLYCKVVISAVKKKVLKDIKICVFIKIRKGLGLGKTIE